MSVPASRGQTPCDPGTALIQKEEEEGAHCSYLLTLWSVQEKAETLFLYSLRHWTQARRIRLFPP